jgi:hypothetical protein
MNAAGSTSTLQAGKPYVAHVELKDGRMLATSVDVDPPRPVVALLNKGVQNEESAGATPVQLGNPDDLPVVGRLVFFLKSNVPATFPRDEKIEVAAADSSFRTLLTLGDGSLMLEDANTAMGSVEPLTRFGSSAFGPVRVRAVAADGAAGDWLPLGSLVRVPGFKELRCPRAASKPCMLTGTNLFLAASFASTPSFENPTEVPPEFTGTQLVVPHPVSGVLYLKLRDDPASVQTLTLPVTTISLPVQEPAAAKPVPAAPSPAAAASRPNASPTEASPANTAAERSSEPDSPATDPSPAGKTGVPARKM